MVLEKKVSCDLGSFPVPGTGKEPRFVSQGTMSSKKQGAAGKIRLVYVLMSLENRKQKETARKGVENSAAYSARGNMS